MPCYSYQLYNMARNSIDGRRSFLVPYDRRGVSPGTDENTDPVEAYEPRGGEEAVDGASVRLGGWECYRIAQQGC